MRALSLSRLSIGLVAVALGLAGCSHEQAEYLTTLTQDLTNGQLSGPEDNAVIKLEALSESKITWACTGTLVAPNLVLTARHCVTNFVNGLWTCDAAGNLISTGPGQMGTPDTPSNITVFIGPGPSLTKAAKGKAIFSPNANTICLNDIALVLLDTELTALPIKPIRLTTGTFPGEDIRSIGYGVDGSDSGFSTKIRRTRSGIPIAQVGPSSFRPVGDPIAPRTFLTNGSALCDGDSGGPAFSDADAVVGVFSQLVGNCTSSDAKNIYTQIAPFMQDIVLPAFQASGYEPWLEGNSEPGLYGTGGAGTGGATSAGGASLTGGGPPTGGSSSATGGATSASDATGGAPLGTGGDTSVVAYDQGPAPGGTCACRASSVRYRGWGAALFAAAVVLGLARRRR